MTGASGKRRTAVVVSTVLAMAALGSCCTCVGLWSALPLLRGASRPSSPGVYLSTARGWQRLTGHDRDAFFGAYPSTRSVDPADVPRCVPTCRLLIVNVPSVDPTRVYFGVSQLEPRPWDPQFNESRPTPVHREDDGVYSVDLADDGTGLDPGDAMLMALVARGSGFNARAFFFIVYRPEASR